MLKNLHANVLVEAGAGTGKTQCLVDRLILGLSSGHYQPSRTIAITFTRNAAAELRQRLQQEISNRQLVIPELDLLFVGTIHAFCAQLLRFDPLESNLSPGFQELDEAQESAALDEAWDHCWATPVGLQLLTRLDQVRVDPQSLRPHLLWMCQNADLDFSTTESGTLYAEILAFLTSVIRYFQRQRALRGTLTFHDLLRCALELSSKPSVQQRYDTFLVDEFQDTDPIQVDLLFSLTRCRPGSLFLVGDPKQSIYRFRGADMRTYQKVRQRWIEAGFALVSLTHTRRLSPELCDWLNRAFTQLFPQHPTAYQSGFTPMISRRSPSPQAPVYRLDCPKPETVAQFILGECQKTSYAYSDFMVIASRNSQLEPYRQALEAHHIPCEAPARRGPFGAIAASLLLLLRHLVDPQDKAVLVGLLRGPLFGHSDPDLYAHVQRAGTLRPYPPGGGLPAIDATLAKLDRWRVQARWLPLGAAAAYLIEQTGLGYLAQHDGANGSAQLQGVIDHLRRCGEQGKTFAQAVSELTQIGVVALAPGTPSDAVKLLTVHKAKGLEAKVVILVDPKSPRRKQPHWLVDDHRRGHLHFLHHQRSIARPENWETLLAEDSQLESAEELRLLYVAATRAKQMLVVVTGVGKAPWRLLHSFLTDSPALPIAAGNPIPRERDVHFPPEVDIDREPTWRKVTTSSEKAWLKPVLEAEVTGVDAADWGHLVHALLECAFSRPPQELAPYGRWLCHGNPSLQRALPRALAMVNEVLQSPLGLWNESSDTRLVEVPFGVRRGKNFHFGTIDLAIFRRGGWGIVDYKTDRQYLKTIVRQYARHCLQYVQAWETLLPGTLAYAGLYGVRQHRLSENLLPPAMIQFGGIASC